LSSYHFIPFGIISSLIPGYDFSRLLSIAETTSGSRSPFAIFNVALYTITPLAWFVPGFATDCQFGFAAGMPAAGPSGLAPPGWALAISCLSLAASCASLSALSLAASASLADAYNLPST
jgi:hypothetical protein